MKPKISIENHNILLRGKKGIESILQRCRFYRPVDDIRVVNYQDHSASDELLTQIIIEFSDGKRSMLVINMPGLYGSTHTLEFVCRYLVTETNRQCLEGE